MRFSRPHSFIFLFLLFCQCGFRNDTLAEVDNYIIQLHEKNHFDGSVSIGNRSGIVYSKSIGTAVKEWSIPVERDTRFDVCSLNKSFVAVMIMQLVESGDIDLNGTISSYIKLKSAYADSISIHQILTHTSGLADYDAVDAKLHKKRFEAFKRRYYTNDDYLSFIGSLPPIGKPNERFHYSNFGYHVLSLLIEQKTGMHFSNALDSMICKPLGLSNTYAPIDNYKIYPRLALPYDLMNGEFQKSPFMDYSLGRRIFSTAEDLNRWGIEMSLPTLISDESHRSIVTNHLTEINSEISYGYGWAVFDGKKDYAMGRMDVDGKYIIHGGETDGYKSLLIVYESGEWIVSLVGNIGDQINELEMGEDLMKILIE